MDFYANWQSNITHFYSKDIPSTLRPYVDYEFSSGGVTGSDFKEFDRKYRSAIKKLLPPGYLLYKWYPNHYESSAVIRDTEGRFIYLHYSDVRFWKNEWVNKILIRTMSHEKDWRGGSNCWTDLVNLTEDIQKLWR